MKTAVDAYFRKNRWMPTNCDDHIGRNNHKLKHVITMDEAENYFGYDSKEPNNNEEEEVENELL